MLDTARIPQSLIALPRWIVWRFETRDDELTKVPYQCFGGHLLGHAKSDIPQTWATFDEVLKAHQGQPEDTGIGIMLGDGLIGFDFDDIRTSSGWHPTATDWIQRLNGYAEQSPSGKGIKVFRFGNIPEGYLTETPTGRQLKRIPEKGSAVEIYRTRRMFTVTGTRLKGQDTVEGSQSDIDSVCEEMLDTYFAKRPKPKPYRPPSIAISQTLSDQRILEKIRNSKQSHKFEQLYAGHISNYDSASEADLALTAILMFWCGNNAAQVERIFAHSQLAQRAKWNRDDYRTRTFEKASRAEVYVPKRSEVALERLRGNA